MSIRKSDADVRNHFRCDRFFLVNGQWHFSTREQTTEGPFTSYRKASEALRRYVKAISCIMLEDSSRESVWRLSLQN